MHIASARSVRPPTVIEAADGRAALDFVRRPSTFGPDQHRGAALRREIQLRRGRRLDSGARLDQHESRQRQQHLRERLDQLDRTPIGSRMRGTVARPHCFTEEMATALPALAPPARESATHASPPCVPS